MSRTGSAVSAATVWKPLVGGTSYAATTGPKGILVATGGSCVLVDKFGNSITLSSPGIYPLSPTTVTSATSCFGLF